jgi:membrane-bound metal-dependent hydrolase YbcI (DUF457 family)
MNRNGHLAMAALSSATVSWQLDQPLWQRALSPIVALATAMAPDVDNTRWWQEIRQHVPVKVVRQALNHRGTTHSWLVPLLMYWSQDDPSWVFVALIVGYASHLVADALFGKTGVPTVGWGFHLGLRLPMGKSLENGTTIVATAYAALVIAVGPVTPLAIAVRSVGLALRTLPG